MRDRRRGIARLLLLVVVLSGLTMLAGCNTMKGVGTDIHDAAQNTQNFLDGNSKN